MKNQLKSIALLVSVVTSLFLTSCGGDKESDPKPAYKCEKTVNVKLVAQDNVVGHEKTLLQDCNGLIYVYSDRLTSDTLTYNTDSTLHTIKITAKKYRNAGHLYLVTESKNNLPTRIKDTEGNSTTVIKYSIDYKTIESVIQEENGYSDVSINISSLKPLETDTPEKAIISVLFATKYVFPDYN